METGLLPVLVELRNFSHLSHDLVSCIVESVTHFGETFSEEDARDLLAKGQCQILLDGLDEMDPSEITEFQRKLSEFVDCYPDNQIVLSSRECDALNGIKRFVKLYIHPFDNDQSQRLIDKLLRDVDDPTARGKIQQYMDEGFIKKDGIFPPTRCCSLLSSRTTRSSTSIRSRGTSFIKRYTRPCLPTMTQTKTLLTASFTAFPAWMSLPSYSGNSALCHI